MSELRAENRSLPTEGQQFEIIGASKVAIHDGRSDPKAEERNGKKYFFMGHGEKYDLTKLERVKKPQSTEQR